MKKAFDIIATSVIAIAALLMSAFYIVDRGSGDARGDVNDPVEVASWRTDNEGGIPVGPLDAPVVITEFLDVQCPYCERLLPRIDSILQAYPEDISLVIHHYPLTNHPLAIPGAIATECALRQGQFVPMLRLVMARQDSLQSEAWGWFAREVKISETLFRDCMEMPADSFPRIASGRALGDRTGVRATPTVWVNGKVAPSLGYATLSRMVANELDR